MLYKGFYSCSQVIHRLPTVIYRLSTGLSTGRKSYPLVHRFIHRKENDIIKGIKLTDLSMGNAYFEMS